MSEVLSFVASWFIGLACLVVFVGGFALAWYHDQEVARARERLRKDIIWKPTAESSTRRAA